MREGALDMKGKPKFLQHLERNGVFGSVVSIDHLEELGQVLLDRGASIDAVSKGLGHSSTKATETYYCRRSDAIVREEIDRAWGSADSSDRSREINSGRNDLIETEKYLSGYA